MEINEENLFSVFSFLCFVGFGDGDSDQRRARRSGGQNTTPEVCFPAVLPVRQQITRKSIMTQILSLMFIVIVLFSFWIHAILSCLVV